MLFDSPEYRSQARLRTPLLTLAFSLLAVWILLNAYTTLVTIVHYYNPLPEWDYWRIALNLPNYQAWDFRILWKQHNEHRIIFPELFFAADMLFWHGHEYLPLLASFLAWIGTWLALCSAFCSDRSVPRPNRAAGCLLAGIMMLWPGSAAVLGAPFLLQWPLMQLAVVCAFLLLSRAGEVRGARYLTGAIAAGAIATYSSGNGMFVWPLLVVCGVILRLSIRRMMALVVSATACIALYFVQYQFSQQINIRVILLHPLYTLGFLSAYLGMPFAEMHAKGYRIWLGGASLLLVVCFLVWSLRHRLLPSKPAIVLFGYYAFTICTCLVTAGGRMNLEDRTFGAAKAPRYVTVPIAAWAAFILLAMWIASRSRSPKTTVIVPAAIAVLMFGGFSKLGAWMRTRGVDFANQQLAALSVENGLRDRNLLKRLYIDPVAVANLLPVFEKDHLTIYHKGHPGWLGKPVTDFAPILNERVDGTLVSTYPVQTGFEVAGWVDDSDLHAHYRWIVLADDQNRIVGFGERFPSGVPDDLGGSKIPLSLAWAGFVSDARAVSTISAYLVDPRRRRLMPIGGSIAPPAIKSVSAANMGALVSGFKWTGDEHWTPHKPRPNMDFGVAPPGPAYASWSGSDEFTAHAISNSFTRPQSGCLILPVLHGPIVDGLSVQLLDAQTRAVVTSVPMQDYDMLWEFWQVKVPDANQQLQLEVRDDGRQWGEWVGVATPGACR